MGIAKNGDMSSCSGICNWNGSLKKKVPVEEGIGQGDRIGMNGRDDVGAWSEILRAANVDGDTGAKKHND